MIATTPGPGANVGPPSLPPPPDRVACLDRAPSGALAVPTPSPTTRPSPPTPATAGVGPTGRWRRLLRPSTLLAAAGVAAAVAAGVAPIGLVVIVFVLVVPFEKRFPRHPQPVRRPHLGTDLAYALLSTPLSAVGLVVGFVLGTVTLAWIPGLLLRPLVLALPALPRTLLGVYLFDLLVYWTHRLGHEVPFLWRFHRIHHSTEHLDWISGFRSHPLDGILLAPPFVVLIVAGFDPRATGVVLLIQVLIGLFLHANVRWRLRPLQKLVATPEVHHWHHAEEPGAWNTNYGGLFPIHDLIFGTFYAPADRRPSRYGVSDPVSPGIVGQLWEPFRGLRNPLRAMRHPIAAIRDLARSLRRGLDQVAASMTRPVRRHAAPTTRSPAGVGS